MKKYQSFLRTFFAYGKMTAQKHGHKSLPVSIAGLSESGVNAEHKGKSCSRLELVVRECGLMLQGMVSVFLFGCLAFYESAEFVPIFPGKSGRKIRSLYRDSWRPFCQSCIPAGIFAIYMTDGTENPSMEFPDFLLHTFILHKPLIFTTSLKRFVIKSRYSFYAENLLCPRWQVERKERTQRRFLPQKGAPRQR